MSNNETFHYADERSLQMQPVFVLQLEAILKMIGRINLFQKIASELVARISTSH